MKIISHRGNLKGPSDGENTVTSIHRALQTGFDVEIDIWYDNGLWLGHDSPQYYLFDLEILRDSRVWIHAKNLEALDFLCKNYSSSNFFWHQEDDFTLTSSNYIWTYPERRVTDRSIIVALDYSQIDEAISANVYGVCVDDPLYVREKLKTVDIEKMYSRYVELCLVDESSPVSMGEFATEVENGKCELCLLFDSPSCDCSMK